MTNLKKKATAKTKFIRIAPSKINKILIKIRGKSYKESLKILRTLPQKSGETVWHTLYSAVSNANHNLGISKENLIIKEAYVNQGPILKRIQPRARGRAYKIEKKYSHLTITVSE